MVCNFRFNGAKVEEISANKIYPIPVHRLLPPELDPEDPSARAANDACRAPARCGESRADHRKGMILKAFALSLMLVLALSLTSSLGTVDL